MAQKEKLVNVPRDVSDEFYRYKMPVLRAKVEGRGNGIKTVIENCAEIAKALDRNPDYVNKFFGFELGAMVSTQNDRYFVNGRHDPEGLAKVLDSFIEKFVLCGGCRNPETNMNIKGDKIFLVCRACGKTTQCDPTNKLVPYMTKRDVATSEKRAKAAKASAAANPTQPEEHDTDDEDWSLSTTKEDVEERRRQILGTNDRLTNNEEKAPVATSDLVLETGQNVVDVLEKFISTNPPREEAFRKISSLATAQGWNEGILLRNYLFPALFAKNMRKDFYKKAAILNMFIKGDKKQQKVLLYCIEKLCQIVPTTLSILPSILNGFYTEELLEEEILIQWYKHPISDPKRFDVKLSKEIRKSAAGFIEWLQKAEEEKSDD